MPLFSPLALALLGLVSLVLAFATNLAPFGILAIVLSLGAIAVVIYAVATRD